MEGKGQVRRMFFLDNLLLNGANRRGLSGENKPLKGFVVYKVKGLFYNR